MMDQSILLTLELDNGCVPGNSRRAAAGGRIHDSVLNYYWVPSFSAFIVANRLSVSMI
jgi:hypothetical protein